MIPNGWRHNPEWHNAHYFKSGRSLCGLNNPGGATKEVGKKRVVQRCSTCRDEFDRQGAFFKPNTAAILDYLEGASEPPMP